MVDIGPLLAGLDGGIKGRLDAIPQLEEAAARGDLAVRTSTRLAPDPLRAAGRLPSSHSFIGGS